MGKLTQSESGKGMIRAPDDIRSGVNKRSIEIKYGGRIFNGVSPYSPYASYL